VDPPLEPLAAVTVTVVVAVAVPPDPVAVSVYVVVEEGDTDTDPLVLTVPTDGEIETVVEFVVDQFNDEELPAVIEEGDADSEAVGAGVDDDPLVLSTTKAPNSGPVEGAGDDVPMGMASVLASIPMTTGDPL
jgi:hypothetical protein